MQRRKRKSQRKPLVVIITPALAEANTGNWHTAARWARFLRPHFRVRVAQSWPIQTGTADTASTDTAATDTCANDLPDVLIALHARRSAASIAAFAARCPDRPLVVVLTGTDLYRDIATDHAAQQSLQLATRLIVLNELGARALPAPLRPKVDVVLQSAPRLMAAQRSSRRFVVAAVGHLRDEKDPQLVMDCARALAPNPRVSFVHIGEALDPALGQTATTLTECSDNYRWLGGLPRARARQHMRHAHVLLHPSKMEGGAQAVIEAITAGTPVIASAIDGNSGLLGSSYPGLFPVGNLVAAAQLVERAAQDARFYRLLTSACKKRAALFDPGREAASLTRLLNKVTASANR